MFFNNSVNVNSFYIHWPFCPYKCHFCPFVALAGHDSFMDRYHAALVKDIQRYAEQCPTKLSIDTLYFGGGTPSTYPDNLILDMFGILNNVGTFSSAAEVTVEVNPGTLRHEQLKLWKEIGINRLSIGVQSLKEQTLKKLNRHQSNADVYQALESASMYFENLSVDFILGLPEVSPEEWKQLIESAVLWPIKHISIYFLMVHEDTALYFGVKKKKVTLPCDDEVVDLYYWTVDYLAHHGFEQYEISNFAKKGFHSQHNSAYWNRKPYKAFGLGACEFDGLSRFMHEKKLGTFLETIERGESTLIFKETLTPEQIYLEKLMLGLRQSSGITFEELVLDLSDQQRSLVYERIQWLKENNFIAQREDTLVLTPKGLAVENDIVIRLSL